MTTRQASNKQEKLVAKAVGGKKTANSGATMFMKGDILLDQVLIECKTKMTSSKSITIKKDWILKNQVEAYQMKKPMCAVAISFGDKENYYIISENDFVRLLEYDKNII